MKYFQSAIERLLYALVVLLVTINVGAGLVVYSIVTHQDQIIKSQSQELGQLKTIVADHTDTLDTINGGFSDLNAKVDCIFKYFATPNRNSNTTITLTPNEQICNVNVNPTSVPGGNTGSPKSGD